MGAEVLDASVWLRARISLTSFIVFGIGYILDVLLLLLLLLFIYGRAASMARTRFRSAMTSARR